MIPSADDLRKLREIRGLTQRELARRAGVSQSLVAKIEAGKVDPRLSTVRRILSVLTAPAIKRELVARDIMHSPVITVKATDKVRKAVRLMRRHDISQLPVVSGRRIVGSIQESTILRRLALAESPERIFDQKVEEIMDVPFACVSEKTPLSDILYLINQGQPVVLVLDEKGELTGIISKIDIISSVARVR